MNKVAILYPLNETSLVRYVSAVEDLGFEPIIFIKKNDFSTGKFNTCIMDGDLTNAHNIINYLNGLGNVVAIIAAGEFSVELADLVAKSMGLKQSMSKPARVLRNKYLMRKAFYENGVDQPQVIGLADNIEDLCKKSEAIQKFPVISKPVDMAGSWFVNINNSSFDIIKNGAPIFDYKVAKATGLAFECKCLLEEYFEGEEFSAEVIVENGEMKNYIINKKIISKLPYFNEVGHICGAKVSKETRRNLERNIQSVINAAGVLNSVLHIEFRVGSNNHLKVIEVGCRVAGDRISDLVEMQYGISLEKIMVELKTENHSDLSICDNGKTIGIRFIFKNSKELPEYFECIDRHINKNARVRPDLERTHISNRLGYEIFRISESDIPEDVFMRV